MGRRSPSSSRESHEQISFGAALMSALYRIGGLGAAVGGGGVGNVEVQSVYFDIVGGYRLHDLCLRVLSAAATLLF